MYFADQVLTYRPHFWLHPRLLSCPLMKKPEMSPHSALHTANQDAGVSTVHLSPRAGPLPLGSPRNAPFCFEHYLHFLLQVQPPPHFTPEFLDKRTTYGRTSSMKTLRRHLYREVNFLTTHSTLLTATTAPRPTTFTDMRLVSQITLLLLLHSLIKGAHPYLSLVNLIDLCYKLPIDLPSSETQMGLKPIHLLFITNSITICVLLVTQNWLLGQLWFTSVLDIQPIFKSLKCLLVVIKIHVLPPPPYFTSLIRPSVPRS